MKSLRSLIISLYVLSFCWRPCDCVSEPIAGDDVELHKIQGQNAVDDNEVYRSIVATTVTPARGERTTGVFIVLCNTFIL